MPLIKSSSKKAFQKNVKTEMEANPGKESRAQNLAIAYAIKRRASHKMAKGGKLDTNAREHIAEHNFALPDRRYPIHDISHARNALSRVSQHGTPEEQHEVREKVHKKYPSLAAEKPMARGGMAEDHCMACGGPCKYAMGGAVEDDIDVNSGAEDDSEPSMPMAKEDDERPSDDEIMSDHFAKGGKVHKDQDDEHRASSIADAIMEKRHRMAEGGMADDDDDMVDLEENSEEEGSTPYDHMNAEAGDKEQYDDSQLESQPSDSNEKGDSEESDEEDENDGSMVSAIRRKMRSMRG